MADAVLPSLETLLRQCAGAGAEPWYPSSYAKSSGVDRDSLYEPLNRLREAGLVCLTDWVKDLGQGYRLTPEGKELLGNPRALERLQAGHVPERHAPEPSPEPSLRPDDARGRALQQIDENATRPLVTFTLIVANVLVFGIGMEMADRPQFGVDPSDYFYGAAADPARISKLYRALGALWTEAVADGDWHRLITMMFVHAGILHLGMNMLALLSLGSKAERLWGRWALVTVYFLAGFLGSCMALAFQTALLVGASGAVCGVYGAEVVWFWQHRAFLEPELRARWSRGLVLNFMLLAIISGFPGVSWAGHLGGVIGGIVAGVSLDWLRFGAARRKVLGVFGLLAIVIAGLGFVQWAIAPAAQPWKERLTQLTSRAPEADESASEMKQFAGYVPAVRGAADTVWQAQRSVLFRTRPPQREADAVKEAATALHHARVEIRKAEGVVHTSGPYQTPRARQARKASLDYLQALDQLCQLAEKCLEGKDTWMADEAAWERQVKVCRERHNLWETVAAQ